MRPSPCRRRLRSEEHTSELQSLRHLVCRLLLVKKRSEPTAWLRSAAFLSSVKSWKPAAASIGLSGGSEPLLSDSEVCFFFKILRAPTSSSFSPSTPLFE